MAYRILRRSRDELEVLREGHRRDPLAIAIATNLVKSLSRFGMNGEADAVLEELKSLGMGDHGFSRSEALMLRGQYADSIEAALRGEEAEPGTLLTYYMAGYVLAAMGEQTEAKRLDPWQGTYADYPLMLHSELRDPVTRLAKLELDTDADEAYRLNALLWTYFQLGDADRAEKMALERLAGLSEGDRELDGANLALGIMEWKRGNREQALQQVAALEQITGRNLSDGDNISLNHLIMAITEYIRGEEASSLAHLQAGFDHKAPMSFEGENVFAIFAALGWNERPEYLELLDAWEARNQVELGKIFDMACNGEGFTVWTPLPESCATYAPVMAAAN